MPEEKIRLAHKDRLRLAWTDPNSFATTLVTLLLDNYGTEALYWDPTTLRLELADDFGAHVEGANLDRLMAGINLLTSDGFYKSLPDFNDICCHLSGAAGPSDVFHPADAGDIAWGITEAMLLSPPDESEQNPFSAEIVAFVGAVVDSEGIIIPPDVLKIGQLGKNLKEQVRMDYSDDPEMFSGIWKAEQGKTDDINDLVRARLGAMVGQLESLPLRNGSAANVAAKMRAAMDEHAKQRP